MSYSKFSHDNTTPIPRNQPFLNSLTHFSIMDHLAPLLKGRLPATKPSWGGRRGIKRPSRKQRWSGSSQQPPVPLDLPTWNQYAEAESESEVKSPKQRIVVRNRANGQPPAVPEAGSGRSGMSILFFPDEILLNIFTALDYTTAVALTGTHVRFWNLVNPMTFYSQERKISDLKDAQANFPRFEGYVACLLCFRLLPRSLFPALKPVLLMRFPFFQTDHCLGCSGSSSNTG
jgi:hypothetical protein